MCPKQSLGLIMNSISQDILICFLTYIFLFRPKTVHIHSLPRMNSDVRFLKVSLGRKIDCKSYKPEIFTGEDEKSYVESENVKNLIAKFIF